MCVGCVCVCMMYICVSCVFVDVRDVCACVFCHFHRFPDGGARAGIGADSVSQKLDLAQGSERT